MDNVRKYLLSLKRGDPVIFREKVEYIDERGTVIEEKSVQIDGDLDGLHYPVIWLVESQWAFRYVHIDDLRPDPKLFLKENMTEKFK